MSCCGVDRLLDRLGGAREGEDLVEDAVHLPHFFADQARRRAARWRRAASDSTSAWKSICIDGERIADLVRDFRGEQAEGGEPLAGAQFFLHVDDAGEQPALLDRDGGEIAQRGRGA